MEGGDFGNFRKRYVNDIPLTLLPQKTNKQELWNYTIHDVMAGGNLS